MGVIISDDVLRATRMTEVEMKQEIAIFLFEKNKLMPAQASRLAKMHRLQLQHLLASRQIAVHDDVTDFETDIRALQARDIL